MFSHLARVGTAAVVSATLLGGSLLLAPAANAATAHKVDADLKTMPVTIKVGAHKDKITLKAATKQAVKTKLVTGEPAQYYAVKYHVVLTNAHKKVIYNKTLSLYRALDAGLDLELGKYATDAAAIKQLKVDAKESEAAAKRQVKATYAEVLLEINAVEVASYEVVNILTWVDDQTKDGAAAPATFDGYKPLPQDAATRKAYKIEITGTPAHYAVVVTVLKSNVTITYSSDFTITYSANALVKNLPLS